MPPPIPFSSRVKGAIFGLAVCDALGGPVEFSPRGSFDRVTQMLPNDNFGLPPGCFTDDTSMTLCLAQSLVECGGQSNIVDQVKKYISWWRHGYMSSVGRCFDIGFSTRSALETWDNSLRQVHRDASAPVEETQRAIQKKIALSFGKDVYCGNGSLMRVLPAALVAPSEEDAVQLAHESSLPTHPHPRCLHACMIYTALVLQTLNGASKTELAVSLAESVKEMPSNISGTTPIEPALAERLAKYQTLEDWEKTPAESIRSTGYVVDTLEASLWAFFNADTFDEAAILAVNLGYDADTVGAICGGLAGAYHGFDAIPESWLREMKKTDVLGEVAQKIVDHRNRTI